MYKKAPHKTPSWLRNLLSLVLTTHHSTQHYKVIYTGIWHISRLPPQFLPVPLDQPLLGPSLHNH